MPLMKNHKVKNDALLPGAEDLWFLPLGGCGEIGMNLNLYGHNGRWLMVDCGITFARPGAREPHVQMADPEFIEARRDLLSALLITHAHEDHIGAVAHLWRRLRCPVYATPFAAAILRRKLAEAQMLDEVPLHVVQDDLRHVLDVFDVEWFGITHSTPESQGLMIRTPAGNVFHTGDWKLDDDPVVGTAYPRERFEMLAQESVTAMVCDSTNALEPGRAPSEGSLRSGLLELVTAASGRVIVGCFGSNVARLRTLASVAAATNRYAGLLGRSLRNYFSAANVSGVWDGSLSFVDAADLGYLPRQEVLAIATGSQGEPRSALQRLATGTHRDLELEPGDTVILSARTIPGNEEAIASVLDRFEGLGVHVIQDEMLNRPIHASGHPARDDLADMYRWVKPQLAIPVHGEDAHMQANAELAREVGIGRQLVGRNGDLFMLAPVTGVRREVVDVGRLGLEQRGLVQVR